ncbi:hypothetical protein scyTo_0006168 [Scyliorhinus torazame]|uniref:Ig-like domain-containing protein n=1 Tax=Scyliorhinus torazame TaxID=75743 RepID=A0A401PG69_SCYTO|nr:hypothetical protein [Scyliorhinus torazame]
MRWGYVPTNSSNIKWLVSLSPGSTDFSRIPGIEPRFSGTSESKLTLKIDSLNQTDSTDYYCQSVVDNGDDWCGCGLTLKVKPAITPRPPSVYLLHPSTEKMSQQTDSKLVCVVNDFYPETVTVSWYMGSTQLSSGISNSGILMESEGSYTIISELAVSTFQWVSGLRYTCVVSHKSLSSPIRKVVNIDDPIPPSIYVLPPTFEEIDVKKTSTIVCLAVGFYPESIFFRWLVNSQVKAASRSQTLPSVLNTNGSYTSRSGILGIMAPLWIVAVVGGLLLIIAAVILIHKKTTSSSRSETADFRETLNLEPRQESVYQNVYYKVFGQKPYV